MKYFEKSMETNNTELRPYYGGRRIAQDMGPMNILHSFENQKHYRGKLSRKVNGIAQTNGYNSN